ncbi:putative lipase [Golovinomyces cichoracearum]|uniref:Putative lipase n=1 Tax=Golovinomyces cichoracearum TaxID=62708 RepID=A0A420IMI7_9PEZI|nr:putative lipase [Golovinomyces cichoracearum]
MLLMYQTGSLKIGEVTRYTITYTPAQDSIHPSQSDLYLRIKNNCSSALRAAYIRGPYNLYVAAFPATYKPNEDFKETEIFGVPHFEPNVRAGGVWDCTLKIPEKFRKTKASSEELSSGKGNEDSVEASVSWIVEISSQVVFSASAAINFEVFLGKNEKYLSVPTPETPRSSIWSSLAQVPHIPQNPGMADSKIPEQKKGVFSRAIKLKVEDTETLWNKPALPDHKKHEPRFDEGKETKDYKDDIDFTNRVEELRESRKPKNIHLVILTHGLHSNLGADMLYLKESIDASVNQARLDARKKRKNMREMRKTSREGYLYDFNPPENFNSKEDFKSPRHQPEVRMDDGEEDEDEEKEEVIVRGFSGNAARTERGVKYLGKRLARYILSVIYPDRPFETAPKHHVSRALSHSKKARADQTKVQNKELCQDTIKRNYRFTSISFIAHSLGGLVQTYAIAYIQKHWPEFFDQVKPVNFIALATPFLGISNENPMYVKFALDFGLIGKTGHDLGLTWSAPTIAKSGWDAIHGGVSENLSMSKNPEGKYAPETKPLLQILPMGPAHVALKKFKNRTLYSNVVNDGIVPLRTSCILFIDWKALGNIEKSQRQNGLIERVAEWGWAEVTGATTNQLSLTQPNTQNTNIHIIQEKTDMDSEKQEVSHSVINIKNTDIKNVPEDGMLSSFVKKINPSKQSKSSKTSKPIPKIGAVPRQLKIYERSQTLLIPDPVIMCDFISPISNRSETEINTTTVTVPPRTSFFESAGDLLNPPLPTLEFFLNFSSRPQSIIHDRIYHPSDIPPLKNHNLEIKKRRNSSQFSHSPITTASRSKESNQLIEKAAEDEPHEISNSCDNLNMKIEEKIARAYHRDLIWRKVLVRLEPDAHNNIIVRRMFANAYGWPVIKHLCDTHFSEAALYDTRHDSIWSVNEFSSEDTQAQLHEFSGSEYEYNTPDLDRDIEVGNEIRELERNLIVEPRILF